MGKDTERGKYASPDGSKTWEYLCAAFGSLGTFIIGILLGWNSTSLAEFRKPNSRIVMTADEASTLAVALPIGHTVAALLGIFVVDRFGRKKCIQASTVPLIISWGMIAVAEHVMVLTAARMMAGFTMGMMIAASSIYTSEVLSTGVRGGLSATHMITFSLGMLFVFAAGPYLGVRRTALAGMSVSLLYLICFWFAPESPYFLVMVGREDEASAALEKLRGKTDVADELQLIRATIREKGKALIGSEKHQGRRNALVLLFTIRGNLKALLIGLAIITMQHLCGLGTILSYCHLILAAIGSEMDVYWASVVLCLLQSLSGVIATLVMDKFGRRPLFFGTSALAIVLLGFISAYFFLMEHTDVDVKGYSIVPLFSIFALVMTTTTGIGAVASILLSEIFATDVKLLAHCVINVVGTVVGIISSKYYFVMAASPSFGHSVPFFVFAMSTLFWSLLLVRWLPETKGKTLLRIQQELNE